jgi:hypothetical protein
VNGAAGIDRLPPRVPTNPGASHATRFRHAWDRAESPIVQERMPVELRRYVRDYFLAIRTEGQR